MTEMEVLREELAKGEMELHKEDIELKKIDWFHETETHRHYVIALNNLELRLYNSLPTSWADWDHPAHILPLLGTSILLQKGLEC